jgi:DNA-directed RNA polymerase I and III subunit RPAC2
VLTFAPSPEVEFCGYSIPHPSEAKMNVRIQTYGELPPAFPSRNHFLLLLQLPLKLPQHGVSLYPYRNGKGEGIWLRFFSPCSYTEGTTALDALEKGLDDLMDLCDVVIDKFIVAQEEYAATHNTSNANIN